MRNNFLNSTTSKNPFDYEDFSRAMADLHSSCFKSPKVIFSKETMFSFLLNCKSHIFYDGISLAIIQVTGLEADLITMAVDPTQQKKSIASNLLELILLYLKHLGVKELFLEVAINNIAGLKLYNKIGFKTCGVRKNYYSYYSGMQCDASAMVYNLSKKKGKFNKKTLQKLYPIG
ncbi:MAG: GNAT family N-acetyltransferase [Paracoccaceae bacterium]|nr:GNAT family N-acetyltransferase [Paracoccaceae bacterium]